MDFAGVAFTSQMTPTEGSTAYAGPIVQGRVLDKGSEQDVTSKCFYFSQTLYFCFISIYKKFIVAIVFLHLKTVIVCLFRMQYAFCNVIYNLHTISEDNE